MSVQLGLGLNRRLGGFNPFNPTHLNPYLLFDTRTSMLGELESPTLDLDPAVPSSLDVITATRSGVATYTDADGLIQTADPNTVRVDYVQGEELTPTKFQNIEYTDFSSGYFLSNFGTGLSPVLSSDALGSPNGTEDAYKIVFNAGSGTTSGDGSEVYFNVSDIEDNIQSTASIYLRGENGGEQLVFRGATNGSYQLVTLTTEWQRFTTTENTSPSGNQKLTFGIRQNVSGHGVINSAATIYAYGPQLEEGTTASDFVPNTTGSPKFIASATYGPRVPMMLIEPSATNLVTYSEDFNTGWAIDDASVVGGQSSPDGGEGATLLKGNTNLSRHYTANLGLSNTVTGSFSLFAKAKELRYLQIASANTTSQYANFDLLSGTIGTIGTRFSDVKMEAYPDGWYRITLVSPDYYNGYYISLVSGLNAAWLESWVMPNDTDGLYIWGAQIEEGSVATSYIPTNGSAVTRNADQLSITGSNFTNFFNSGGDGTFYAEFIPRDVLSEQWYLLAAQDYDRRFMYTNNSSARLNAYDGTAVWPYGQDMVANQLNRAAFTYTSTTQETSLDGSTTAPATHNGNYLTASRLYLSSPVNDRQMNGHLKRLIYWPTHSDNL